MVNLPRKQKIARLRSGNSPRILDLFSGCGGLSLGFHTANFQIVGAIEKDPYAASSHALNFFKASKELQELHSCPRDITTTDPEKVVAEFKICRKAENAID